MIKRRGSGLIFVCRRVKAVHYQPTYVEIICNFVFTRPQLISLTLLCRTSHSCQCHHLHSRLHHRLRHKQPHTQPSHISSLCFPQFNTSRTHILLHQELPQLPHPPRRQRPRRVVETDLVAPYTSRLTPPVPKVSTRREKYSAIRDVWNEITAAR